MADKKVYKIAQDLIKKHGNSAEEIALQKMQKLLSADDVKASGKWLAIAEAINTLQTLSSQNRLH